MKKYLNTRRTILLQITLIIGVAISAIAFQSYAASVPTPPTGSLGSKIPAGFVEPTQAPPNGNALAPLNVGNYGQIKGGGIMLNTSGATYGLIVANGNVGIGTMTPTSKLDVNGGIVATKVNVPEICLGGVCKKTWSKGGVVAIQGPQVKGANAGAIIKCPTGYALTGWYNKDIYLDWNSSRTYNPQMTHLYGKTGGQSGIAFWNGGRIGGSSITQQTILCTPGTFKFIKYSGAVGTGPGGGGLNFNTGVTNTKIN